MKEKKQYEAIVFVDFYDETPEEAIKRLSEGIDKYIFRRRKS